MLSDLDHRKMRVDHGEVVAYVAERGKRIIGFVTVEPSQGRLLSLYVAAGAWKHVGKRLLDLIEAVCAHKGVNKLEGETSINAVEFYRRQGYDVGEVSEHALPNGLLLPCRKIRKQLNVMS